MDDPKENYRLYMENAREMLDIADENFGNQVIARLVIAPIMGFFTPQALCCFQKENLTASIAP